MKQKRWASMAVAYVLVLATTSMGLAAPPTPGAKYKPGEIIVKYKPGKAGISSILNSRVGTQSIGTFRDKNMERVQLSSSHTVTDAITSFESDPNVLYAEPNYLLHSTVTPNDPFFGILWGMNKIGAPAAWDLTTGDKSVVIGIIDTGIDYNHEDLHDNMWHGNGTYPQYGYNAITKTNDPMDDQGHGTHVAGTIGAAGNNSAGVTGVNWNVQMASCKFLSSTGGGYMSDAIDCIDYFANLKTSGVNLTAINNSWGGGGFSQAMYDSIKALQGQGVLFVVAAGNTGMDNDTSDFFPANYDLSNIITVAATDNHDLLAQFSHYGRRNVHIGAPGVNIGSSYISPYFYGYLSGTSMAAPHVTGLAGLIKAKYPDADWITIRNLILSTGDSLLPAPKTTLTGKRINAYNALTCTDSRFMSAVKVPQPLILGSPITLSALSINCGNASGPVTVTLSDGQVITLLDDGANPDQVANDGVFSATFTPTRNGETYTFTSPAGTDVVTMPFPTLNMSITAPTCTIGRVYSAALTATNGIAPYTWSISSGSLPPGLTLASDGTISGTPTTLGIYTFTASVSDSQGAPGTKSYTIQVLPSLLTIMTGALPQAIKGVPYLNSVVAAGGTAPYTFTQVSGSLPAGITFSNGILSGLPTVAGTSTISVKVTDANSTSVTKAITLPVKTVILLFTPKILPESTNGFPYSTTLSAAGGIGPYTWSNPAGALPAGITLSSSGALSGLPTVTGLYPFTLKAVDSQGASTSILMNLVVKAAAYVTTPSLTAGVVNVAFKQALAAKGGTAPYTWSITAGDMAPGLSLSAAGVISGIPTTYGNYGATITVKDKNGFATDQPFTHLIKAPTWAITPLLTYGTKDLLYWFTLTSTGGAGDISWELQSGSLPSNLTLGSGGIISGTPPTAGTYSFTVKATDSLGTVVLKPYKLLIKNCVGISTSMVPNATVGTAFSNTLVVTGGTAPYTWSVADGVTPPGLTLSNTGVLSGKATAYGNYNYTLSVTDVNGSTASKYLSQTVLASAWTISTAVTYGTKDLQYWFTMTATGGAGDKTWTLQSGTLPPGLNLGPDGIISGTPVTAGAYAFTVKATDSLGVTVTKSYTLTIKNSVSISTTLVPNATVGTAFSNTLAVTGGSAPYTWSVTDGALPPGLALSNPGVLSGKATAYGIYYYTVTVTDVNGSTASKYLSQTVLASAWTISTAVTYGTKDLQYWFTMTATGGAGDISWALQSGTLPPGLNLGPDGIISGTPVTAGAYAFSVKATDSLGSFVTKSYSLTIKPSVSVPTATFTVGTIGVAYSKTLVATGGTAPYTWAITDGGLPTGLVLSSKGVISGKPTESGTWGANVAATDINGSAGGTSFVITVK